MQTKFVLLALILSTICSATVAQEDPASNTIPTATQWTLDAAGPTQRTAITSVFLMYCPKTSMKGTGFLLKNGLVVTNAHVVAGCDTSAMIAIPSVGANVKFKKMATDEVRDLALLRPATSLNGGLELGPEKDPSVGAQVSTWGFPLTYNGPPPLLSVGYVAGFNREQGKSGTGPVKHLVVNGAFNPGNSGGPLFRSNDNKVIGIVVAKFHLYPPVVEQAISALANNKSGFVYNGTDEHGANVTFSEAQILAVVLEQFYKTTQVMIGEAISVSELRAFLATKEAELR